MTPEEPALADQLHAQIMNIPVRKAEDGQPMGWSPAYLEGHRDARHAAAELVVAALTERSAAKVEPVAWRFRERINNDFDSNWVLTSFEPPTTPRTIAIEPLYATPTPEWADATDAERYRAWRAAALADNYSANYGVIFDLCDEAALDAHWDTEIARKKEGA